MPDNPRDRAHALFDAGDFSQSRRAALEGLASAPQDVELLVLAGRAGIEVDAEDAADQLRRAVQLAPEDAVAWHHLGEALAAEGRTEEADAAFRRTVELNPEDRVALSHLGHTSLVAGRDQEGVGYLARAADSVPGASTAAISLVDMYRTFGEYDKALAQARQLVNAVPDDVPAWLDVAQLSLEVGNLDEARNAFEILRGIDDVPGHEAYPLHGLIDIEIRAEQWERVGELASQATAIDPQGLGADVAAFVAKETGGPEAAPTRAEVQDALTASLVEYRRMHADDRRLAVGESDG